MYEIQNQQKVNIWARILNETIIVPFFIEVLNLNADNYLAMLQDEIDEIVRQSETSLVKTLMTFDSSKMRRYFTTVYEYANI